jgi:predicted nucleic acid-binding protein
LQATGALIAATAIVHGLTLLSRNPQDFQPAVKSVLNPWR